MTKLVKRYTASSGTVAEVAKYMAKRQALRWPGSGGIHPGKAWRGNMLKIERELEKADAQETNR
jgi:hypothetical protein